MNTHSASASQKIRLSWKKLISLRNLIQKVKHLFIPGSLQIKWNGLTLFSSQFMKNKNTVSQNIRILRETNKKRCIIQKCKHSEKYVHFWTQYLVTFAWTAAPMWHSMETISLWHCCWGVMEAQVPLMAAFSSSGLVPLIFLLTIPHSLYMGFRWGALAGQSST